MAAADESPSNVSCRQQLRLVVVGNTGVGKTSLLKRLVHPRDCDREVGTDDNSSDAQNSVYTYCPSLPDGVEVELAITDTRGAQKEHHNLQFHCSQQPIDAFILVFALPDPRSFDNLPTWMSRVKENLAGCVCPPFFLIGNKLDAVCCPNTKTVDDRTVAKFLEKHQCEILQSFETSTGQHDEASVHNVFTSIAKLLVKTGSSSRGTKNRKSLGPAGNKHEQMINSLPASDMADEQQRAESLRSAVSDGQLDRVRSLLDAAPFVDIPDALGRSLLWTAAAVSTGDSSLAIIQALKDSAQSTPAWPRLLRRPDNAGVTPMMAAAAAGRVECIARLHELGANLHTTDKLEFTALTHAACRGQSMAVSKLLELGALAHCPDFYGNTPLIWAARAGYPQVIRDLTAFLKPDEWRHVGEYGMDALGWAKHFGHRECQELVKTSIATNAYDSGTQSGDPTQQVTERMALAELQVPPVEARGLWYDMQRSTRGCAILIVNQEFPETSHLSRRDGAETDFAGTGISQAFVKLGLTPMIFRNRDSGFLLNLSQTLETLDCAEHDAFALCISSHGDLGYVYGSDGVRVRLEGVFDQVRKLPGLHGKPKLFLVQSCRASTVHDDDRKPVGPHADCFYLFSVAEGGLAQRNIETGCLFTRAFRDIVLASDELPVNEFPQLMPQLVDRIAKETQDAQIVSSTSTLRKLLFFPPLSRFACSQVS